jgi:thioredoxin 1
MVQLTKADTFHDDVYHTEGPVVVTFGSPSCGPCKALLKNLENLEATGVKVLKLDITEDPEIASHFNISSVPTTLVFARGAHRVRLNGVAKLTNLQEAVANAVKAGDEKPHDHAHA